MICTASVPGVATPGGICVAPAGEGGHLVMFQAPGSVEVQIKVVGHGPTSDAALQQLAQAAYGHAG